jgi:hypothetical protein
MGNAGSAAEAAARSPACGQAVDARVLCEQLAHLAVADRDDSPKTSRSKSKASDVKSQVCAGTDSCRSTECDSDSSGSERCDESVTPTKCFETDAAVLRRQEEFRVKFLSKLSHSRAWVPQTQRPRGHETVIIFDWDDTLLCTSYCMSMGAKFREELPVESQVQLRQIARAAGQLLEEASRLGQTFIVTNAEAGWVEHSAAAFMPEIQPTLDRTRVISARSRYELDYPGQVGAWKEQAFLDLRRQLEAEAVGNLISIGDSVFEMDAVAVMGQEFAESCVKTVRFRQQPTPKQLLQELNLVLNKLSKIVAGPKDLKLTFESPNRDRK